MANATKSYRLFDDKNTTNYYFTLLLFALTLLAYFIYDYAPLAMWFGFCVAGYSTIANDSIQTLGTFLSSNKKISWYLLWLFVGGILVLCMALGWYFDNGDIAFDRLTSIPQPQSYSFLELCTPILLVLMTYLRMPVSTTFLLLSVFSSGSVIKKMLLKTFLGYSVAFGVGLLVFFLVMYLFKYFKVKDTFNVTLWRTLQFLTTAYLWATWIMHDTANIAVFLPRSLSLTEVIIAVSYLFFVIGLIMYLRGGGIQCIVTEKTSVTDVRSASIIDFIYACLLVFFKELSHIPMSTTWVFLGLLAGREIAYRATGFSKRTQSKITRVILSDVIRAGIGLVLSLLIALMT